MRVHHSFWVPVGCLLAIAFLSLVSTAPVAAQQCNSNDSGAPCFVANPDILGGRTSLLRDDDLVLNTIIPPPLPDFPPLTIGANLLTENSTINAQTPSVFSNRFPLSNVVTIGGRLFNVNHDQIISTALTQALSGQPQPVLLLEGTLDTGIPLPSPSLLTVLNGSPTLYGTSGGLLGNGWDQMVVLGVQSGKLTLQALAAYDPLTPGDGIIAGPAYSVDDGSPVLAVTTGVFTDPGPGTPRPAAQLAVLTQGFNSLVVTFYSVNASLNITLTGQQFTLTLPPGASTSPAPIAITAGRFNGGTHDQLAIAYPVGPAPIAAVEITTLDFNQTPPNQGTAFQVTTTNTGFKLSTAPAAGILYPAQLYLAPGKFNWFSNSDQLGISVGTNGANGSSIGVMSFDSSLNGTVGAPLTESSKSCHFGLAAGRFDNTTPNQNPTQPPAINPNLQLADVATGCGTPATGNPFNANIYTVDPNSFAVTLGTVTDITSSAGFGPNTGLGAQAVTLVAGDEQARSLALGAPDKVSVVHEQPDTVLGLPPMHVDWIKESPNAASPSIINLSAYPNNFNVSYSFTSSSTQSVSRSGTTSYTLSTKETANEKVSYGVPGIGGASVKASQAATQLHQNSIAKTYNTYEGLSSKFTTRTAFDDVVAATVSQLNAYTYPVLGQCTNDSSGSCTIPLYVQFSGPDNVNYLDFVGGSSLEWYQPVEEPGNIFSYPPNVGLLGSALGGGTKFNPLSGTDQIFDPQQPITNLITWTSGSSAGATVGTTSTHSFDSSVSMSANASYAGFGASAGSSFDYNDSTSLSTLNQSTSTLSSSQGISLQTGTSTTAGPSNYDYQMQTIIYGQIAPTGTIQSDAAPQADISANGYIAVRHLADVIALGQSSGSYWTQTYNVSPDIALNHPQRWYQKYIPDSNTQEVQFNCPYGYTSSISSPPTPCAAISPTPPASGAPAGIAGAAFYQMKGLFVTPFTTHGGGGPQITSTVVGSKVTLAARVYNYSLANFPANSALHVQFYAQPWDTQTAAFTTGTNADGFAPAVFIGDGTTADGGNIPPPAFCGGIPQDGSDSCPTAVSQNWEYVYTTWDTSTGGVTADSTWKFWVLAWVTDSSGHLVTELTDHGLKSLPSNTPYNSIGDVPIEVYSNNLGFYNQVFSITAPAATVGASQTKPHLQLGEITTRNSAPVIRDVATSLLAPHIASGNHIDSITTLYYDGDPAKGGTLFDVQRLPRVLPGSTYVDGPFFQPKTCGQHQIFARAIPVDGAAPVVTSETSFKVTVDPVSSINSIITFVKSSAYPPRSRAAMLAYLDGTKKAFTANRIEEGTILTRTLLGLVKLGVFFLPPIVEKSLIDQLTDLLGCL